MCAVLEISKRTYYKYRNGDDPDYLDYLMIKNIFNKSKGTYGYRRITEGLKIEYGVIFNHKKVQRIMNKFGLKAIKTRVKYINLIVLSSDPVTKTPLSNSKTHLTQRECPFNIETHSPNPQSQILTVKSALPEHKFLFFNKIKERMQSTCPFKVDLQTLL